MPRLDKMTIPSLNQIIAIAALILASLALWTFADRLKPDPVVNVAAPLPPAKEVRTVEKIIERPKIVYVYPDKVKDDLGLPQDVQQDAGKKVVATGKLEAEERDYTLSSVLDIQTGQSEVYARPDPLPLIGPGRQGAIGVAYGIKNGEPVARVYARHDLIQIKALHAGAIGMVDQDSEWFAGGYLELRF